MITPTNIEMPECRTERQETRRGAHELFIRAPTALACMSTEAGKAALDLHLGTKVRTDLDGTNEPRASARRRCDRAPDRARVVARRAACHVLERAVSGERRTPRPPNERDGAQARLADAQAQQGEMARSLGGRVSPQEEGDAP